ncbi:hypothetical protein PTR22_25130, partial [Serratia ureilytica]
LELVEQSVDHKYPMPVSFCGDSSALWGSGSGKFISRWAGGENNSRPLDGDGYYPRATTQKPRDRGVWAHHNQNGCSLYGDILSGELKSASAPLMPLATLIPAAASDNPLAPEYNRTGC